MKLVENISKFISESHIDMPEIGELTSDFISESVISCFFGIINTRNLNKRLRVHEEKINNIWLSANNSASREFFTMKLTPIVFEKIINEHEDDKIDFILNGFENCVKNEITDLDKILFYFDIISDLRLLELRRFISYSKVFNVNRLSEENSEEAMMLKSIDEKLHREGLIAFPEFIGGPNLSEPAILSDKGKFLLKFMGHN